MLDMKAGLATISEPLASSVGQKLSFI